jgi:hypothetical protein
MSEDPSPLASGVKFRRGHVFVAFCVGSGLCDEPSTRSEESYWFCVCVCVCVCMCVCVCVCVCDIETSTMRRSRPDFCFSAEGKKKDTL